MRQRYLEEMGGGGGGGGAQPLQFLGKKARPKRMTLTSTTMYVNEVFKEKLPVYTSA